MYSLCTWFAHYNLMKTSTFLWTLKKMCTSWLQKKASQAPRGPSTGLGGTTTGSGIFGGRDGLDGIRLGIHRGFCGAGLKSHQQTWRIKMCQKKIGCLMSHFGCNDDVSGINGIFRQLIMEFGKIFAIRSGMIYHPKWWFFTSESGDTMGISWG